MKGTILHDDHYDQEVDDEDFEGQYDTFKQPA